MHQPQPVAYGTRAERDLAFDLIPQRHRAAIARILSTENVGFTNLKLENTLRSATAFTCNLERFGALRGQRRRAVEQIGQITGFTAATDIIFAGAEAIGRALGLLRLPVNGLGLDLSGDEIRAFKAYCRTDRASEQLETTNIISRAPSRNEELAAAAALAEAVCPTAAAEITRVLAGMHEAGSTLDAFGIDIGPNGDVELKLYLLPRVESGRRQRTFTAAETEKNIAAALDLCGLAGHGQAAIELASTIQQLDLPCSHVAIDVREAGDRAVKVYFDTWGVGQTEQTRIGDPASAKRAIVGTYRAAGVHIDQGAADALIDCIYAGGLIIDSVAVDFESDRHAAKTYLRSAADMGEGVVLPDLMEFAA